MKIRKSTVDELIYFTRRIWNENKEDKYKKLMRKRIDRAVELCKSESIEWSAMIYLLDAIFLPYGFAKDAGNDKVYEVISLLGWEVVDDGEEHPASE